jgi:Ni/Fe-hydrogenase 1 B-type cytochrome subunit
MASNVQSVPARGAPHRFFRRRYVWQWPVRVFHWVNAISVAGLFATGLYIANPKLAPAGEAWRNLLMAKVHLVHYTLASVMLVNFLWRSYWFWMGNHYARSGFPYVWRPRWWADLFRQLRDYLRLDRGHIHLGHNSLGGLMYTIFVIGLGWVQLLSGFALYSEADPKGFWGAVAGWVIPLAGGSFQLHMWHHLFAWGFVFFSILHVYIVFYDGQQFKNGLVGSIISGEKFFQEGDVEDEPGAR